METKTSDIFNNDWRKIALSVYRKPIDSKIYGSVEVDVTDLEAYVQQQRSLGVKITLTHIFTLFIARALKEEVPELNAYVMRGRIVPRKQVDVTISILLKNLQMGSVLVKNADKLTLSELSDILMDEIRKSRSGTERDTMTMKARLAAIPWPLRGWIFSLLKTLTIGWGVSIPRWGLSADNFGSFMVSNIGTLGLDEGYPALLPISNISFVVILGGVSTKPWVVDGQVVPRRVLWIGTALDHRIVDGSHGGKLFRYVREAMKNPSALEQKPDWA